MNCDWGHDINLPLGCFLNGSAPPGGPWWIELAMLATVLAALVAFGLLSELVKWWRK
jgi:hypothetical protein